MAKIKDPTSDAIRARELEEKLYEAVAQELAAGVKREGLWLKALANAGGDELKARALYVRLRVQAMLDEMTLKAEAERRAAEAEREEAAMRGNFMRDMRLLMGLVSVVAIVVVAAIRCGH